jgi:hypothetical protein
MLPDDLHETFDKIVRTGLKLVLATNPIFPFNVQIKRLVWPGPVWTILISTW